MGNQQQELLITQAECYRLIKRNEELTNTIRELMQIGGVDNVQALAQKLAPAPAPEFEPIED